MKKNCFGLWFILNFVSQGTIKRLETQEHVEELAMTEEKVNLLRDEVSTWQRRAEKSATEVDQLNDESKSSENIYRVLRHKFLIFNQS